MHKIVVVGAGFGGLQFVHAIRGCPVEVVLIDKRNHHLFQPLLYQVATSVLATSEIAWPIRHLCRKRKDVMTLLDEVVGVDRTAKTITLKSGNSVSYDTLVLATGAQHAYFGNDRWALFAPGLKTLEDATAIRRRVLIAFEKAELSSCPALQDAFLTFVIVGAGPTGVEIAGMIAELAKYRLPEEFRRIDSRRARVILVEAGNRVLPNFPAKLSEYSRSALEGLGVEVRLRSPVSEIAAGGVTIDSTLIRSETIIWAAGVQASPAAQWLSVACDKVGRVRVGQDLTIPGDRDVFVIGDTASVTQADGTSVPGVAPAAKQQGHFVARLIAARISGKPEPAAFQYKHKGNLATIGRRAAVVDFGWIQLKGAAAWWIWGIAHIYFLIGTRSRLAVAWSWLWIHFTGQHSARLITQKDPS